MLRSQRFRMAVNSKLKQMVDVFRVSRFQAGLWPVRALSGGRPKADAERRRGSGPWLWMGIVCAALLVVAWIEIRTSVIESWLFTTLTSNLTYDVRPGAASVIVFPRGGPVDVERGYPGIPRFAKRLEAHGYRVAEQARFSRSLAMAAHFGLTPPYSERPAAGLVIRGADDEIVYDATPHDRVFTDLAEIPPVIEKSLLFVEDRELGGRSEVYRNPAVDWDRLAKAVLIYVGNRLGMKSGAEGGSTLAVQMEKYRHSESGRTEDPLDKLRQVGSASLRAYHAGPDTRVARRRIVLDYLNTMPLAAAPDHGEVHGLKEGLRVWFGRDPEMVMLALQNPEPTAIKARAFKQSFALLCAVRAPSNYLIRNHDALEARVNAYARLLAATGIIDAKLAALVRETPLVFSKRKVQRTNVSFASRKATDLTRRRLSQLLETTALYDLDRLDLEVETTIDRDLQQDIEGLLQKLRDPAFVEANGLRGDRLLATGDPRLVIYSFALFEHTPGADLIRVHADNLNKPFDVNHGMKMELGSTAKLRTLAHYLDIMNELHDDLGALERDSLARVARTAKDPLTLWAAEELLSHPKADIDTFLEASMERTYSGNPSEMFFTGGGIHYFGNFDKEDNSKVLPLREATAHSTNLIFIRLMRDLVRYHTARLPYDVDSVYSDVNSPVRKRLLDAAANEEAEVFLGRAYRKYKGVAPSDIPGEFLERKAGNARDLAVLYIGWHPDADSTALARFLIPRVKKIKGKDIGGLLRKYKNPDFTLADYAYLLDRHPLEVWCAGALARDTSMTWSEARERSTEAKLTAMAWLMRSKNKGAQDTRIRSRIEREAFARMEPSWKKLGFPFESLVPSLATAIGSSADRPDALATLMGIIVDDGIRRSPTLIERLRFASSTPYHTVMDAPRMEGDRVLSAPVCRTLRSVLAGVVDHGTASRVRKAFADSSGNLLVTVGGKTGSGDNRVKAISKGGGVISSHATSRTAAFAFYIGDRYYGVITASVMGARAENYEFTSALPLEVMKMAAPPIMERLGPFPAAKKIPQMEKMAVLENSFTIDPSKHVAKPKKSSKQLALMRPPKGTKGEKVAKGSARKEPEALDESVPTPTIKRVKGLRHTAPAAADSLTVKKKKDLEKTVDKAPAKKKGDWDTKVAI